VYKRQVLWVLAQSTPKLILLWWGLGLSAG
jgi:hypothetical protein